MVSTTTVVSLLYKPCYKKYEIMATATNVEKLRQYKSRFSLIVEQVLDFTSSINLVRENKNLPPNFKRIA